MDLNELAEEIGPGGEVIVKQIPSYIADAERLSNEAVDCDESATAIYWDGLARLLRAVS